MRPEAAIVVIGVPVRFRRPVVVVASGWTPIYPCHVSAAQMRTHPIGTGPFKFVEFKPNEYIKVVKNPDYWKPSRPYLDAIKYTVIQAAPTIQCETVPWNISRHMIVNRSTPPFDNANLRRAMEDELKERLASDKW